MSFSAVAVFTVTAVFVRVYDNTHTFMCACDTWPYVDNDTDCFMATDDSNMAFFSTCQYSQIRSADTG